MARSMTTRVEHLEPKAEGAWRRAWQRYAARVEKAIPNAVLEAAMKAPDDEAAWEAFQAEHGLTELAAWHDRYDVLPVEPDEPDMTRWPHTLPPPPPEPRGVYGAMQALRDADGDVAAYASAAVLILGLARCVREARG